MTAVGLAAQKRRATVLSEILLNRSHLKVVKAALGREYLRVVEGQIINPSIEGYVYSSCLVK